MNTAPCVFAIWILVAFSKITATEKVTNDTQKPAAVNETTNDHPTLATNKTMATALANETEAVNSNSTANDQAAGIETSTPSNKTETDRDEDDIDDKPSFTSRIANLWHSITKKLTNDTQQQAVNETTNGQPPSATNETTLEPQANKTDAENRSSTANEALANNQAKANETAMNKTETDSDEDDWIEGKPSFTTRLSKMWHCIVDDYREPSFGDVRFFLFTRKNRHRSEELNLTMTNVIREQIHQLGVNPLRQKPGSNHAKRRSYREANKGALSFTPLPESSPIKSKYFNVDVPTKFIIHGYTESSRERKMVLMKRAYLNAGDYNVIMVDWHVLAKPPCYVNAVHYTKFVGYALAKLVDQLHLCDVDLETMHMVGFSLGAHIAGYAGNKVVRGNVFRITGLDPALPLYMTDDPSEKLDRTDAKFVDVIHTNAGMLGQNGPTGHADFYPNGGKFQPGCDMSDLFCSHNRAAEYFLESIFSDGFRCAACGSYKDFKNNAYNESDGFMVMGEMTKVAEGSFYLFTNSSSPYAIG